MGRNSGYFKNGGLPGFEAAALHIQDFDGTEFATFENDPARGIYGVDEAYLHAIEETFASDDPDALKRYRDMGEHANRTPLEIVHSVAPAHFSTAELKLATSRLVASKLAILEGQVGRPLADGTPWPRPVPGFIEYSKAVSQARSEGHIINQAILSAGHASFIFKCYDMLGLQHPDILVDNETMQNLHSSLAPHELAKPSRFPFNLIRLEWLELYGVDNIVNQNDPSVNARITVVGDSDEKDGGLARNAGVNFVHVTKESPAAAWNALLRQHGLGTVAVGGSAR